MYVRHTAGLISVSECTCSLQLSEKRQKGVESLKAIYHVHTCALTKTTQTHRVHYLHTFCVILTLISFFFYSFSFLLKQDGAVDGSLNASTPSPSTPLANFYSLAGKMDEMLLLNSLM